MAPIRTSSPLTGARPPSVDDAMQKLSRTYADAQAEGSAAGAKISTSESRGIVEEMANIRKVLSDAKAAGQPLDASIPGQISDRIQGELDQLGMDSFVKPRDGRAQVVYANVLADIFD